MTNFIRPFESSSGSNKIEKKGGVFVCLTFKRCPKKEMLLKAKKLRLMTYSVVFEETF